jgi:glycosyltransferase involved in cell wall biosynthesis
VALPRPLFPGRSGGEIRVRALLRRLAGRHEFTVLSFADPASRLREEAAAAAVEAATGASVRLVWRSGAAPAPGLPAVARPYSDPAMAAALGALAAEGRTDLVQLEFTQMAQYAAAARRVAPVVLTEHDASALTPASSYLRGDAAAPGQRAALRAHLREAFAACAAVVTVSAEDAARLKALAPRGAVSVVPTGVDLERFAFAPLEGRVPGEAVFVGHWPHYPNEEAAARLCRGVLPRLARLVPGAALRLVGSAPTPGVRALAAPPVALVGEVAEVAPELRRARVFLAPMRLGFGIKGKLLEAFACGTPVVASPRACEAMPGLRPGAHLLVAGGEREFAAAAARLLRDDALSARLARAARAYVEERFGWDAQAERLDAVYRAAARR